MRWLFSWIVVCAFASACSTFGSDVDPPNVDAGEVDAGSTPEAGEAGIQDAAASDVGAADGADAADAADAADVGVVGVDADVYPGIIVVEEHFESGSVGCPTLMPFGATLTRSPTGRSGKACRICKVPNERYFGAATGGLTSVDATYTIYAWVRSDPSGTAAPPVEPVVSVNGNYSSGAALVPDATWRQVVHPHVVAAAQSVAAALYTDTLNPTPTASCYLVDDLVLVRE